MNQDSKQQPIQDIQPLESDPSAHLMKAEIEHNIPVRRPVQNKQDKNNNPITSSRQFIEGDNDQNDPELDNILKDVNQKVNEPGGNAAEPRRKFMLFNKKSRTRTKKAPEKVKKPKPILTVLAALIVAGALSVAAYYAFKPAKSTTTSNAQVSNGKVGTSDSSSDAVQAAGGTLVQPGDLSDLSNSLQSKINTLNDSQDFNPQALSDQSLGL